jgi:hypothetical protein
VDDLFLSVLAASLDEAHRSGQTERAEQLEKVSSALLDLIQESQPPEVRFINELLSAEYPEGTRALLEDNQEQVDSRLLELMGIIGSDFEQRGRPQVAQRLEQIREQAASIVS